MRLATSPEPFTAGTEGLPLFDAYAAIVNVSDSPGKLFGQWNYHWFPIAEHGEWGYTPFYAAAKLVDHYARFDPESAILVHCHAGACRSPAIVYALYLADPGKHQLVNPFCSTEAVRASGIDLYQANFEANIRQGHIPEDIVAYLAARHEHPTFSSVGLQQRVNPESISVDLPEKLLRKRALVREHRAAVKEQEKQ